VPDEFKAFVEQYDNLTDTMRRLEKQAKAYPSFGFPIIKAEIVAMMLNKLKAALEILKIE